MWTNCAQFQMSSAISCTGTAVYNVQYTLLQGVVDDYLLTLQLSTTRKVKVYCCKTVRTNIHLQFTIGRVVYSIQVQVQVPGTVTFSQQSDIIQAMTDGICTVFMQVHKFIHQYEYSRVFICKLRFQPVSVSLNIDYCAYQQSQNQQLVQKKNIRSEEQKQFGSNLYFTFDTGAQVDHLTYA